jgi:hypothetical protein
MDGVELELAYSVDGDGSGGVGGSVDSEVMVVPSPTDSTGQTKKKRNVFLPMKVMGKDNKPTYPFIENPDDKETMMYIRLLESKPFETSKGKGVIEAWASAVDDINKQLNKATNRPLFDPPIAVKTVRDRFDNAMKMVKEITANTPFNSGCDDEEPPNTILQCLEDLYEMKTSFDDDVTGQKTTALAAKKKDLAAAKAIQEAAIGRYSSSSASDNDASDESGKKAKRAKIETANTEPGEKKPRGSLNNTFAVMAEAIEGKKELKAADLELKRRLLDEQQKMKFHLAEEQLKLKKFTVEEQVKIKKEQHQLMVTQMTMMQQQSAAMQQQSVQQMAAMQQQSAQQNATQQAMQQQQMQMTENMMKMMDAWTKKMADK